MSSHVAAQNPFPPTAKPYCAKLEKQIERMDAMVQLRETASNGAKPRVPDFVSTRLPLARKFVKFCLVGGSGMIVDMGVLFILADPRCLGLNITLSKICAAEVALISNFIWNDLWTFQRNPLSTRGKGKSEVNSSRKGLLRRFFLFNTICGIGIGLAVLLLHLFHRWFYWDLYVSNLAAIILVTLWNFGMNAHFNWNIRGIQLGRPQFGRE